MRRLRRYWQVDEYPDKSEGMTGIEVSVPAGKRAGFDGRSWRSAS